MTNKNTGSGVSYYIVKIDTPTSLPAPYEAECNDIIEALNMTYAEGNVFKAVWRQAAARMGLEKHNYDGEVYDTEKAVFFANRMLVRAKNKMPDAVRYNYQRVGAEKFYYMKDWETVVEVERASRVAGGSLGGGVGGC